MSRSASSAFRSTCVAIGRPFTTTENVSIGPTFASHALCCGFHSNAGIGKATVASISFAASLRKRYRTLMCVAETESTSLVIRMSFLFKNTSPPTLIRAVESLATTGEVMVKSAALKTITRRNLKARLGSLTVSGSCLKCLSIFLTQWKCSISSRRGRFTPMYDAIRANTYPYRLWQKYRQES